MALILLFYNCYLYGENSRLIEAWIKAIILWSGLIYFSLEILSVFSVVSFNTLLLFWASIIFILSGAIWRYHKKEKYHSDLSVRLKSILKQNRIWAFLSVLLIYFSFRTVPYNWDSMTYHLSRIANWAQNRSVGHYGTNVIRQIVSPVLAEFVNLHVYILSGQKDYLLNLLQCISALTNVWLVYEIAVKIGCGRLYARIAAFLLYTAPIAFGEALTTQVDQYATVWLLIFVYYYVEMLGAEYRFRFNSEIIGKCLIMGSCIAFGYLTKPSILVGVAVFAILLLALCIKRKDSARIIGKLLFCVISLILLIIAPEMVRNIRSFGSISLPIAGQRQLTGTLNPFYILVNGLKNFTFNIPNIYWEKGSHWVAAAVYRIAAFLHVEIDATSISEGGLAFGLHDARTYGHDTAVNAVVFLWFIFCAIWGIYRFKRQENRIGRCYSALVSLTFLLFCCIVRWEPFVSRYMLSYLALLCPMIAFEIEDFRKSIHIGGGYRYVASSLDPVYVLFRTGWFIGISWGNYTGAK